MVKHWWAVLLVFGLAGSLTAASAQVLKGKTAETKSESTLKKTKQSHEDAASKDARTNKTDKLKVQSVEGGHATDAPANTSRKAGGMQQDVIVSGADLKGNKSDLNLKQPSNAAATKATTKNGKGGGKQSESLKITMNPLIVSSPGVNGSKSNKSDLNLKQAGNAAATKAGKAGGKQQSESMTITKKDILVSDPNQKGKKSGPDLKAMPQDATKNARKQVDKASPK